MKTQLLSALALTATTVAIASTAPTAEAKVENVHQTRWEFLDNSTKAVENVHQTRWDYLDSSTKAVDSISK